MEKVEKNRQSNFELLRLVAIFMVIVHHLVIKSAQTCGYTHPFNLEQDGVNGLFINGLVLGGVNIFLLISGWFGIKKIGMQIIRLVFDCFFYCFVSNLFCIYILGYPFSWNELFFSCSFTHNWFVYAFIIFLLLSPIVERSLAGTDEKTMRYFVILLTIVNVVFGYFGGIFRHNGYNAYNFVYLFMIGRYLHMISINHERQYRLLSKWSLPIWLLCALLLAVGFIFISEMKDWDKGLAQNYFGYNNPLVILSSISLFIPFSVMKIKSKIINRLAKGVFGVFLLHTTTTFIYYRINIIGSLYKQHGYMAVFLSAIVLFMACSFISLVVERIKAPIFNQIRTKIKF